MGIVNRRNAVVGWLVLKAGKRAVRKKARAVVPARLRRTKKSRAGGVA